MRRLFLFVKALRFTLRDLKYNYNHIKNHTKNTGEIKFSYLRMYCHMLDKAMNNIYFEKGHSKAVYSNAKNLSFELELQYKEDSAYKWALEILKRFEDAQVTGCPKLEEHNALAYTSDEITIFKKILYSRTSCRNFKSDIIPSDIIRDIVAMAVDAPNGCCRQVVRYHITQKHETIELLKPCIAGLTNFTNVSCLVGVSAEASVYDIIDKNLQYVDCALSVENFLLGASLYGIQGTICNFFHATNEEIFKCKQSLNIPETENIVMFIALGYPATVPEKPIRRSLNVFYKEV